MKQGGAAAAGVAVALALLSGCGRGPSEDAAPLPREPADAIVARVGERVIRVEDVNAEARRRAEAGRPAAGAGDLLQEMVMRAALVERAQAEDLHQDPGVKRRMETVLISALRERELQPQLEQIEITDEEIRAEYERRKDAYTRPAQVRLAGLRLQLNPGASDRKREETVARLAEARRQVLENPPRGGRGPAARGFGALAIRYSEDQASRYRGGDLGWLKAGATLSRWPAAVIETGFELETGAVSDVMNLADGVYLVMKTDQRPAYVTPFEKVRAVLRQSLLVKKRKARQEEYFREVVESIETEVHSNRLADVQMPALPKGTLRSGEEPAEFPLLGGQTDEE